MKLKLHEDGLRRVDFGRPGVAFPRLMTLLMVGLLAACGGTEGGAGAAADGASSAAVDGFDGAAGSLDLLGEVVLDGLLLGDTVSLEHVRVTETEHNEQLWPEMPAARPEVNYPVDMAWENIERRNQRDRARLLAAFGAVEELGFRSVDCRGGVQEFSTYRVHTDCYVLFESNGDLYQVQAFKDVVERAGGFKLFRYYDELPERLGTS